MTIKKIVLSTAAFGFATCNMLAMHHTIEALKITSPKTLVFVEIPKTGNGVQPPFEQTTAKLRLLGRAKKLKRSNFFDREVITIEKHLDNKNYVTYDSSHGERALVLNGKDRLSCISAEDMMAVARQFGTEKDVDRRYDVSNHK
jgi:hypothetical protein